MTEALKILILENSPYHAGEIMLRSFYPSVILSDHFLPQFNSKEASPRKLMEKEIAKPMTK